MAAKLSALLAAMALSPSNPAIAAPAASDELCLVLLSSSHAGTDKAEDREVIAGFMGYYSGKLRGTGADVDRVTNAMDSGVKQIEKLADDQMGPLVELCMGGMARQDVELMLTLSESIKAETQKAK